jgi:predicted dehydrogenase
MSQPVGYAVVGLGAISQQAVLPAFGHSKNAKVVAVVSGDKAKAQKLAQQYGAQAYTYAEYAKCLANPAVEAVYIATPPGDHEKWTVEAAKAGKHVLCEKPLGATVAECKRMVAACRDNDVLLMTAYRKYYEPASVALKRKISSGELGRIDVIHTMFTEFRPSGDNSMPWLFDKKLAGGGPLVDIGIYCINTSRWAVSEDPIKAVAWSWKRDKKRYKEVEEGITFRLHFPSGTLLEGTASYGSVLASFVTVHGEKGWATLAPAFAFEEERRLVGKASGQKFDEGYDGVDEFALELDEFADCIRTGRVPEPDGEQGLKDLVIIDAIYKSAKTNKPVSIKYPPVSKAKKRRAA